MRVRTGWLLAGRLSDIFLAGCRRALGMLAGLVLSSVLIVSAARAQAPDEPKFEGPFGVRFHTEYAATRAKDWHKEVTALLADKPTRDPDAIRQVREYVGERLAEVKTNLAARFVLPNPDQRVIADAAISETALEAIRKTAEYVQPLPEVKVRYRFTSSGGSIDASGPLAEVRKAIANGQRERYRRQIAELRERARLRFEQANFAQDAATAALVRYDAAMLEAIAKDIEDNEGRFFSKGFTVPKD